MTEQMFYMTWREDFYDQYCWFTQEGLEKEFERFKSIEGGEFDPADIQIIKGVDVTDMLRECMPKFKELSSEKA